MVTHDKSRRHSFLLVVSAVLLIAETSLADSQSIAMEWMGDSPSGRLVVENGRLGALKIVRGQGRIDQDTFSFQSQGDCRLEVGIDDVRVQEGSDATLVHVQTDRHPFSFFLRDVNAQTPMVVPAYQVVVTQTDDARSGAQIVAAVRGKGGRTWRAQIQAEPEESYENAAAHTRSMYVPTWLGTSRDARIFEIRIGEPYQRDDLIVPKFSGSAVHIPELGNTPVQYFFTIGRGRGCRASVTRELTEGVLPILEGNVDDGDVQYRFTAFVTLEKSALRPSDLRGTSYLAADGYAAGHMFTPEQQKQFEAIRATEVEREEETVLYGRIEAAHTSAVPRYAWFKAPALACKHSFDRQSGFSLLSADRIYCLSRINGKPCPQEEIAVLVQPGGKAVYEFLLPHRPISRARATALAQQDFQQRLEECRQFWKSKLDAATRIKLPEKRIEEMIQAGLAHLDLICFGLEPHGTLAPMIGVYAPIGSESSPIIQFLDSMGCHAQAERALQYFLDKQHDDGMIQNFGGYMLETGAALWSMGEHFRLTRDESWVQRVKPNVLNACDFLIRWRERNKREDLRGKGWGLIEGRVADPPDPYHVYMLNGYAYLGLARAAEMLKDADPANAQRIAEEAEAMKADIRTSLQESLARSPLVPLGDGSWCPTAAPWAEATGPSMLFVKDDTCYTHGTFAARDAMLGPLYLVFQEVVSPEEEAAGFLLDSMAELTLLNNAGYSQPYYCRHDWVQLKLGLVKPFLKTYYNTFASLADRQTYTFNEHYFYASPHKTHEEAWFLMETRWMFWMEEGRTLKLLSGIPRAWLAPGQSIEIDRAASYFGPFSLRVDSQPDGKAIVAKVQCAGSRRPSAVEIRLPHPDHRIPAHVTGGRYQESTESVLIEPFTGQAEVRLELQD
jgi:hypothetical protein